MSVEFRDKSIGHHGANIFYKEFTVYYNSNIKTYRLGSFYFVRKAENPVTIAEFQLIWKNDYTGKKYASVKLYFSPKDSKVDDEDDEEEEEDQHEFGKDEVIEADRQVVIECALFPFWECSSKLWSSDIGEVAFSDISVDYMKKIIKEGYFPTFSDDDLDVKIISYPQYCRFVTCKRLMKTGVPMTLKLFMARGGIMLKNMHTLILFSRWKFRKPRVEDLSLTRNVTVPVFKGRPRKKKRRELMLLKQKKQKKLMKEIKKWKIPAAKRKYKKRANKENAVQDGPTSASSAASRILEKYKKSHRADLAAKKEAIQTMKVSQQKLVVPKGRKATDGRLRANKLKKAALEAAGSVKKEIGYSPLTSDKDSSQLTSTTIVTKSDNVAEKNELKSDDDFVNKKERKLVIEKMLSSVPAHDEFIKELYAFMKKMKTPIVKIPSMGHAPVDFYDLFIAVVKSGGYHEVTERRQWREIYDGLGRHSNDITNAAFSARKIYENNLLPYEDKMRNDIPGMKSDTKRETLQITSAEKVTKAYKKNQIKNEYSKCLVNDGSRRNAPEKKTILSDNSRKPCEYKRIASSSHNTNKSVSLMSENDVHSLTSRQVNGSSSVPPKEGENSQGSGTTSFTIQAGEAFKLMIQKRRGRPSKDFRNQIEQLKRMNHKVEVEVFPPVGKRTRLPTWLNELNVDIVNPRRKRKRSSINNNSNSKLTRYVSSSVERDRLTGDVIPHVTNGSQPDGNNSVESGTSSSTSKIETYSIPNRGRKSRNGYPEILPKSPNGYITMVPINSNNKLSERLKEKDVTRDSNDSEFAIKSVESLAKPYLPTRSLETQGYVHIPSPHSMSVPRSALHCNQYRPRHTTLTNNPRYSIPSSLSNKEFASKILHNQEFLRPTSSVRRNDDKSKNTSFDVRTAGPNLHHIHFPTNDKRTYTSNHHFPNNKELKDNVHLEKIYVHHPSHIKPANGKSHHELINHFPHSVALIPAQIDPKVSSSSLTLHNYIPPSNMLMSPTTTMYRNISGVRKSNGDSAASKPSLEKADDTSVEPKPKVYILPPERSWVVPRTSV